MRNATVTLVLAASLLLAFGTASTHARQGPVVKKRDVDMVWKPDQQDILGPGNKTVLDTFDSSGAPFGDEAAQTLTPRSQVGQDSRSGKWRISVNPGAKGPEPGTCFGTYKSDRNVIETTPTQQTVEYGGTLRLDGCRNTKKFKNAEPGRLGTVRGETTCTANHCRGGLSIEGSIRF